MNLTTSYVVNGDDFPVNNINDLLPVHDDSIHSDGPGIPVGSKVLAQQRKVLLTEMGTEGFLRIILTPLKPLYDYIIIDTQPTRDSQILSNAIAAADYVLIPMQCDAFSEDSAFRTYSICSKLSKDPASRLKGIGVVLTMVDKGAATRETREECKSELGSALFEAEIPMALAVKSSVRKCVPVCYSARTQPVGRSYAALYKELKERLDKLEEN
jgi:chromosome partitioning protein